MKKNILNLFSLFQKLDYRDKDSSGFKKLTGIIIAYLFSNSMLSLNFSLIFNERSFVIMALTSNLFLIIMIVINDFDNLFLGAKSIETLRSLPLRDREIFSAKFISAAAFLLIFIGAASLPQVIFFYFINSNIFYVLSFLATDILFSYAAVSVVTLLYCIIVLNFKKRATVFLNLFQFLFFIFVFYSTSMGSRSSSAERPVSDRLNILENGFFKYLPQSYFSGSVYEPMRFLILLLSCLFVIFLLYRFISMRYNKLLEITSSIGKKSSSGIKFPLFEKINRLFIKFLPGSNAELASFGLVRDHLKNSRFLRLKYLPLLFIPVVVVLIGFFTGPSQFLFFKLSNEDPGFFNTSLKLISPSILMTIILCSRILVSNTKILDENSSDTRWIFDSLPVKNISSYIRGANSFIFFAMIMPMIIFVFLLITFTGEFYTVFLNFIFTAAAVYFIISVASLFDKNIPFTLENSKFNSATKFLEVIFSMILGIVVFFIQIFVFQNIIFVLSAAIVFTAVSYFLNRN
ncbi:MAG: hypothetical protein JSS91_03925 [Bacteroidetes bacterium]|nr:hypothetical protein [Bacteroidota bacterium]